MLFSKDWTLSSSKAVTNLYKLKGADRKFQWKSVCSFVVSLAVRFLEGNLRLPSAFHGLL